MNGARRARALAAMADAGVDALILGREANARYVSGARRLWLAGTVSMLGTEVSNLAIPLTAVLTLGAGSIGLGVLYASRDAPSLLFGLFAGPWVDRLRRRPVLIVCDLARAAVLISIPLAWIAGLLSLAYLGIAAFVVGTLTVFFDVAHASYLPTILRRTSSSRATARSRSANR